MINWKVRIRQGWFWSSLISLSVLLAQQIGFEVPGNLDGVLNTVLAIATVLGIVQDPTTKGFGDSNQALTYEEPKG